MVEKTILLDVFPILHRAYHAVPPFTMQEGQPIGAIYGLVNTLLKTLKDEGLIIQTGDLKQCVRLVACFDSKGKTHRHDVYKEYKATRMKPEDDFISQIDLSYQFFEAFNIPAIACEEYEADDIIGTLAKRYVQEGEVVIITSDHDLLQLVRKKDVKVMLFSRGTQGMVYDEDAVEEKFGFGPRTIPDYKGLRGDPSDNIPGVRGIGDIGAKKILAIYQSLEGIFNALSRGEEVISKRITTLLNASKEEAFLSRDLATIVCNIPLKKNIDSWKPNCKKLVEFLNLLEMKELAVKVQSQCGFFLPNQETTQIKLTKKTNRDLIKKIQVALWVLDSNNTTITHEEIVAQTGADTFEEAYETARKRLEEKGILSIFLDIELPLIDVIDVMEKQGIYVEKKILEKYDKVLVKEKEELIQKMRVYTEDTFNPNSPKQVAEVFQLLGIRLGKKTNKGNPSTNIERLTEVKDQHDIVPLLVRYRHISKLQTGYTHPLQEHIDENGRVHTTFLQHGTTTGRLASKNPNLQNIPNHSKEGLIIRNAFVAGEGRVLASLDYSQMEIRIAALLSQDPNFLSMVTDGKDIHTETAMHLFNKQIITKKERDRAKRINFGILYGMGPQALAKDLEVSFLEAQTLLKEYKHSFPQLNKYLESVKDDAHKDGYVSTYFGRRRYFPLLQSANPRLRSAIERASINAPIQGTAADIVKIAMVKTAKHIAKKNKDTAQLLLQVHDELVFEIQKEKSKDIVKEIQHIMENEVVYTENVSFPVTVSIGKAWGAVKKIK